MNTKKSAKETPMSKEKKPIFSDSYLDAVANEINQLYGKREQEINLTDRTKRNK
jgi:hypothetical protein